MTAAAQNVVDRYHTDQEILMKEAQAGRDLTALCEKCRIILDNIELKRGFINLNELNADIFVINDCLVEMKKTKAALENAQVDSEGMLQNTKIDKEIIYTYRSYQDPLPAYEACIDRVKPLMKSFFVRMGKESLPFKAVLKLGCAFTHKIETDDTVRLLCGGSEMTLRGIQKDQRWMSIYLDGQPEKDESGMKLALLLQLSMEVAHYYAATMMEVYSSLQLNSQVLSRYQFEKQEMPREAICPSWQRDLKSNPPKMQILGDPDNAEIFKDFSLSFKKS